LIFEFNAHSSAVGIFTYNLAQLNFLQNTIGKARNRDGITKLNINLISGQAVHILSIFCPNFCPIGRIWTTNFLFDAYFG